MPRNRRRKAKPDRVLLCDPKTSSTTDAVTEDAMSVADGESASRRVFIKGGGLMFAGSAMGPALAANAAYPGGSDLIKIGLVGCGWRGTASVMEMMNGIDRVRSAKSGDSSSQVAGSRSVCLSAIGDLYGHAAQTTYRAINSQLPKQTNCRNHRFAGQEAINQVIQSDVDLVVLATPPPHRALSMQLAIDAGKHVFMELPLGTDPAEAGQVLACDRQAQTAQLATGIGLHQKKQTWVEAWINQIRGGGIGDLLYVRSYGHSRVRSLRRLASHENTTDYQIKNWRHFRSFAGDLLNEAHCENMLLVNRVVGEHPISASGTSQSAAVNESVFQAGDSLGRLDSLTSVCQIAELVYASGVRHFAQCHRDRTNSPSKGIIVHGSQGSADFADLTLRDNLGRVTWRASEANCGSSGFSSPARFVADLREGVIRHDASEAAVATMTSLLGSHAATTSRHLAWNDLFPAT